MNKEIELTPSPYDIAHSVIFGTPILPAGVSAIVASVKSAVFLLVVDLIFYFGNLLASGQFADLATVRTVVLTQLGYMLLRIAFAVSSVPGNPLTPLFDAAAVSGETKISALVAQPAMPMKVSATDLTRLHIPESTDIHTADIPPATMPQAPLTSPSDGPKDQGVV